jgi:GNAT superfamily N-acetyltransferase
VTYVAHLDGRVVGYYALTASELAHDDAPPELIRRMPHRPVPVVRLVRLAVDRRHQGTGLGARLLRAALLSSANAADIIGARAVVVDAKDPVAAAFYEHFDFDPFPDDPFSLYLAMHDLHVEPGDD